MVPMNPFVPLVSLLILFPLSLSQPLPSAVFCDRDGLCLTENGNQAVCGFLGNPTVLDLPRAEVDTDGYKIRVLFREILQEPENTEEPLLQEPVPETEEPQPEEPSCNPKQKTYHTSPQSGVVSCEPSTATPEAEPMSSTPEAEPSFLPLLTAAVDPDNPILGGVGCETRAFTRRCRLCCSSTAFRKSRDLFRSDSFRAESQADVRAGPGVQANVCQSDVCGSGEAFSASSARRSSDENCFQRQPLGFFRSPNAAFFRVCDRSGICNPRTGCSQP